MNYYDLSRFLYEIGSQDFLGLPWDFPGLPRKPLEASTPNRIRIPDRSKQNPDIKPKSSQILREQTQAKEPNQAQESRPESQSPSSASPYQEAPRPETRSVQLVVPPPPAP